MGLVIKIRTLNPTEKKKRDEKDYFHLLQWLRVGKLKIETSGNIKSKQIKKNYADVNLYGSAHQP